MCALALSLQHPHSTHAHAPFQLYCIYVDLHTHIGMHISQQQIYMQVNIFLPHSFVTALLFPLLPPPPHLSVWERPLGFVLSVTCIFAVCVCVCTRACVHTYACIKYFSNKGKSEKILSHQKKWTNLKLEL